MKIHGLSAVLVAVIVCAGGMPAGADSMAVSVSTPSAPVNASPVPFLSPGRYAASIAPEFNSDIAGRIEQALRKVNGVEKVSVHSSDASAHFTIRDGVRVSPADLQKAVAKAFAGGVISTPLPEHAMSIP